MEERLVWFLSAEQASCYSIPTLLHFVIFVYQHIITCTALPIHTREGRGGARTQLALGGFGRLWRLLLARKCVAVLVDRLCWFRPPSECNIGIVRIGNALIA